MQKRGQIAFEYIVTISFVLVILFSILVTSDYYSKQVNTIINTNQVDQLARQIVETAETVYYYGQPTRSTIKAQIPKGIKDIQITTGEINFVVRSYDGDSEINYPSEVPLQGNILSSAGIRSINIEAREGYVWINGT